MAKRWMAVIGAGILCLVASACSSSPSTSNSAGTTTTTTSSTTSSSTPTTRTKANVALCTGAAIGVSGQQASAAAGHQGVVILFVNKGSAPCRLYGYPGAAGLNSSGDQVVQAQRTPSGMMGGLASGVTTLPKITLSHGQTASAVVEGTDVPSGSETTCPTYPALLVTAPNTNVSVKIPLSLPGCSPLQVHPVVPGTSGSTQS